jgi:hypothetical protein
MRKVLFIMTLLLALTACTSETVSREELQKMQQTLNAQATQLALLMATPTDTPTAMPTATPTPNAPTDTPTAPAAPTNTGGFANCIDPYTLDDLTGKSKGFWVRVSTESCAFTHRTYPDSFTTTCPQGDYIGQFVCTFDVLGDVVVHEGIGQSATVWGATIRFMPSYQGEDVCTVWHNEARDGQQRVKPFIVRFQPVPGGKTCP